MDIDTDGDGKPDINIDTDGDGKPDVNIDTDGDGKPDVNIDTDGDGKPDVEATKDWLQKEKKENPQISIEDLLEKGDEEHEDPRAPEAIK